MTLPEPIARRLLVEVNDLRTSPFRTRAIVRECELLLPKVNGTQAEILYVVLGIAYFNLQSLQKSLEAYQKALKLGVSGAALSGIGVALLELGRPADALEYFFRAVDDANAGDVHASVVTTLANIAEAFWLLGDADGALKAFQEAIAVIADDDYEAALTLANQAAELGAYADAVRFLARFLSGTRESPVVADELMHPNAISGVEREILLRKAGVAKLLRKMDSFGPVFSKYLDRPTQIDPSRTGSGAVDILNDTSDSRARVNTAVLGEDFAARS